MRLFRLFTTLLLLAVIVLFVRQNLATFNKTLEFSLDLFIREEVRWTHRVSTLILISGFVGFLVGFFLMLKPFLHTRKALQQERQENQRLLQRIEEEVKSREVLAEEPAAEEAVPPPEEPEASPA